MPSVQLVGPRVWFVIQDMYGAVADLQEVYAAGDSAAFGPVSRRELDHMLLLKCKYVIFRQPDRYLDCNGDTVVGA